MDDGKTGQLRNGIRKTASVTARRFGFHADKHARTLAHEFRDISHRRGLSRESRDLILIEHHPSVAVSRKELPNLGLNPEFGKMAILNPETVQKPSQRAFVVAVHGPI
jgi:hypothetical protein